MVNAMIQHFSNGNKSQFARKLNVTPQTISTWIARNTFDIDLIFAKCEGISARWLLSGEGDIVENAQKSAEKTKKEETPGGSLANDLATFNELLTRYGELYAQNKALREENDRLRAQRADMVREPES